MITTSITRNSAHLVVVSLINAPDQLIHAQNDTDLERIKDQCTKNPRYKGLVVFSKNTEIH